MSGSSKEPSDRLDAALTDESLSERTKRKEEKKHGKSVGICDAVLIRTDHPVLTLKDFQAKTEMGRLYKHKTQFDLIVYLFIFVSFVFVGRDR